MPFETTQDVDEAAARLARRTPESLASFIVSLTHDDGPIGEHVRAFILADVQGETIASLEERIGSLTQAPPDHSRHQSGAHVGQRLTYILDTLETAVLPKDPRAAFSLLVRLFENDGCAMESCGDHHGSLSSAFERAAGLMSRAVRVGSISDALTTVECLSADDAYGLRRSLDSVAGELAGESAASNPGDRP